MPKHLASFLFLAALISSTLPQLAAAESVAEQRERLKELIDKQVEAEVDRRVDPRAIGKRLGLQEWPVPDATMTVDEVEENVKVLAREKMMLQFPETMAQEAEAAAEKKYRMYEAGDKVEEFIIRDGKGVMPRVKGIFLGATPRSVKIAHRHIAKSDMKDEDLARFYKDVHERLKRQYIADRLRVLDAQRDSFEADYIKEFRAEVYTKANYVMWKRRWVAKKKLLDMAVEYTRDKERKKIRPRIEEETYTENGYVLKEGAWVPANMADKVGAKLRGLFGKSDEEGE